MSSHSRPIRRIARLDVKGPNLIKCAFRGFASNWRPSRICLEILRIGADELIYIDIVAVFMAGQIR